MVQPVIFLGAVKRFLQPRARRGAFLQSQCLEFGEYWNQSRGWRQKTFCSQKRSKEKKKKEDVLTSVVEVLKDMSQQDTTADLRKFFQEENEWAREHEMRLFQLFMSGTAQSQGMSTNNLPALNSPGPSHVPSAHGHRFSGDWYSKSSKLVSMHQVKCINNPGAMRQIPTQLGQPITAYEIISNKILFVSFLPIVWFVKHNFLSWFVEG